MIDRSRRWLLQTAGTVTGIGIAGCLNQDRRTDETTSVFDSADIRPIIADPLPTVDRPEPVSLPEEMIKSESHRVQALLGELPADITRSTVPNGAVRETIRQHRNKAQEYLETGAEPKTNHYEQLRDIPPARDSARQALTTYESIDRYRENTLSSLRSAINDEIADARATVDTVREGLAYRGKNTAAGRERTALLYADAEADLRIADTMGPLAETASVIDIGAHAGDAEHATATASVWETLLNRTESTTDLRAVFATVVDETTEAIATTELPESDSHDAIETVLDSADPGTFATTVVWEPLQSVFDAREQLTGQVGEADPATGVKTALRFEQDYRALQTISDRLQAKELTRPEDPERIRTERAAAINAVETAADELATTQQLAQRRLAETRQALSRVDTAVQRAIDADGRVSIDTEYGEYAYQRARLEALPAAAETIATRLQNG